MFQNISPEIILKKIYFHQNKNSIVEKETSCRIAISNFFEFSIEYDGVVDVQIGFDYFRNGGYISGRLREVERHLFILNQIILFILN